MLVAKKGATHYAVAYDDPFDATQPHEKLAQFTPALFEPGFRAAASAARTS